MVSIRKFSKLHKLHVRTADSKTGICFEMGTCKVSERPRHGGGKRALFEFTLLRERVCAV